ncbi:HPr family phosphocarrier protein [Streptomyces sp. NPDC048188]|uniref:HPr family phosphocarrier protein n=1 Tax=Streptomyces sp. NPDC048188 TaxID=3155749 RepID=UPI003423B291
MPERRVTVGWAEGLHARAATVLVKAVKSTGVPMTIAKEGGTPVNAGSMLGLLALGSERGDTVVLAAEDDAALDRVAKLVQEGLDELPPA